MSDLAKIIETAFTERQQYSPNNTPGEIRDAVQSTLQQLDNGTLRVCEKINGQWVTHKWIKEAILLHFKITSQTVMSDGTTNYFDKVALKYVNYTEADFNRDRVRIVPPATVRQGCHIATDTVIMPSYINIGAFIDSGTLVDTWATVGSCAQIGKNVHLSGGAGIGGVLEPLQANPTIIEDNCFIGARSEVVEGVIVEEGAVISMGVYIGQSTPIYDRETDEIHYGHVPAGAVVIPGNLPSKDGRYSRYSAIIVKRVDEKTRGKVSLNDILRGEYA